MLWNVSFSSLFIFESRRILTWGDKPVIQSLYSHLPESGRLHPYQGGQSQISLKIKTDQHPGVDLCLPSQHEHDWTDVLPCHVQFS